MVANDRGSFTIWTLGLCMALMALIGISIDVWRTFEQRHEALMVADAMARSGAAQMDEDIRRQESRVEIDIHAAQEAIDKALVSQENSDRYVVTEVVVQPDYVSVEIAIEVQFGFTRLFSSNNQIVVAATSRAQPFEG